MAAEVVGARSGLGYLIWNSWQTFAVDERYAGLLVISPRAHLLRAVRPARAPVGPLPRRSVSQGSDPRAGDMTGGSIARASLVS